MSQPFVEFKICKDYETSLVLSVLGTINLNSTVYFIPITPLTDTVCAINFYCIKIIIIIMKWDVHFRGTGGGGGGGGGGWREKVNSHS